MAEGDRLILATDRCSSCGGAGWTWWSPRPGVAGRGKWVVCRSCLGTGRSDQTGAKRQMPAHEPSDPSHEPAAEPSRDEREAAAPGGGAEGTTDPDATTAGSD